MTSWKNKKQGIVLDGQSSSWTNANAIVLYCSILGPLLFLTYVNDFSDKLQCNPELMADKASLFSIVKTPDRIANERPE